MTVHGLWTGQGYYLSDANTPNDQWWLDGSYTAPPVLTLRDAVVGTVNTDNWWSGQLNVFGPSTIANGLHVGAFSGFDIELQRAIATLDIDGSSSVGYHAHFNVEHTSSLNINGTLSLSGANTNVQANVGGNGSIVLSGRPDILPGDNEGFSNTEFGYNVASSDTIWCLEGNLQFDRPQLVNATIEGLGNSIGLASIGTLSNVKLTASDFFATSSVYDNVTGTFTSSAIDLHLHDTPYGQVVMTHFGSNDYTGGVRLTAVADPNSHAQQITVHQTA